MQHIISLLKMCVPKSFHESFRHLFCIFSTVTVNQCSVKLCRSLDSNPRPLLQEATALPTEPLPKCAAILVCAAIAPAPGSNPKHTINAFFNLYYWNCNLKRTKINKKRPGLAHFLKKCVAILKLTDKGFIGATRFSRFLKKSVRQILLQKQLKHSVFFRVILSVNCQFYFLDNFRERLGYFLM